MLNKMVRNFLIGFLHVLIVFSAYPVIASDLPEMPAYMKHSGAADEETCWNAYVGFMRDGDVEQLKMIFTFLGKGSTPKRSELCYQRLFGLKVGKSEEIEGFNEEIKAKRKEFREKLLNLVHGDNAAAKTYAIEAVNSKYFGFQGSELSDDEKKFIATFMPKDTSKMSADEIVEEGNAGDGSVKDRMIKALIKKQALWTKIKEVALDWAETSDATRTVVLEGVFESRYGLSDFQSQALELLEKYALLGNGKAFEIMRTKIGMQQIKEIAKKPEVIEAARTNNINGATEGWETFLRDHGLIDAES